MLHHSISPPLRNDFADCLYFSRGRKGVKKEVLDGLVLAVLVLKRSIGGMF